MALRSALDKFRNLQTFVLAIVVIGAFLIFYGITLVYTLIMPHTCQNCNSYEGLEKVTSTLGPIVAAIIGYYFGQRPIQRLARDAQQAASERDGTERTNYPGRALLFSYFLSSGLTVLLLLRRRLTVLQYI